MRQLQLFFIITMLIFVSVVSNSCKKESTKILAEANKNIVGAWKISSVTRNNVDITENFDFSKFSIEFKADGSYTISNLIPFVVSKNGTWELDDATHPLHISFTQTGTSQSFKNEFDYPVVEGVRRIVLTGSPGCTANTYEYSLVAAQ